jgi:dienelactone hydrolase
MEHLTFVSNGARLAADLHDDDADGRSKRPGLLVLGSWLTVKEQMATTYARRLAADGFAAMTFDYRGFGASEGEPREVESGHSKAIDILNAIAFLAARPEVDENRIGVVAICASAH